MARRTVKEHGDRVLRDKFGLKGWVQDPESRRGIYFEWCGRCEEAIGRFCDEESPNDDAVVKGIESMVETDDSFHTFVEGRRQKAELLLENDFWDRIIRVGAQQIYYEYLVAKENDSWP